MSTAAKPRVLVDLREHYDQQIEQFQIEISLAFVLSSMFYPKYPWMPRLTIYWPVRTKNLWTSHDTIHPNIQMFDVNWFAK